MTEDAQRQSTLTVAAFLVGIVRTLDARFPNLAADVEAQLKDLHDQLGDQNDPPQLTLAALRWAGQQLTPPTWRPKK